MRLCKKGHQQQPKIGFGIKKSLKHKNFDGFYTKIIKNVSDIQGIDKSKEVALISSKVGIKNRLAILKEAKHNNIKVVNVKDIDRFIIETEKNLEERRKENKKKIMEKKKKQEVKEKKEETKEEKEKEIKKEVLGSKIQEPEHKKLESMPKDKNIDFPKQKIIPGNKSWS